MTKSNWIYIIDEEFNIQYSNVENIDDKHSIENKKCYQAICKENKQCDKCPLRKDNKGKSILFDYFHNKWISVNASTIHWPNAGNCYALLCRDVESEHLEGFYKENKFSEYNELIELNYMEDDYLVIRNSKTEVEDSKRDSIRKSVQKIAKYQILPEDRQQFLNLWCIDAVGKPGIPKRMLSPKHCEFRRKKADGSYQWVQQILIPVRKSSNDSIILMTFYNVIEVAKEEDERILYDNIYSREQFFYHVMDVLNREHQEKMCIVSIDIEKFKLFNEWYGREAGNDLLNDIIECLYKFQKNNGGIAGSFGEDDFAYFMPYDEDKIKLLYDSVNRQIKMHCGKMNVWPAFGIYIIVDDKASVYQMYDRAKMACAAVKGKYISRIRYFEPSMLEAIESELLLLSDIEKAFKNQEFTFFLHPKCDMKTGLIEGAEALARWNKPEQGIVYPGVFIPFLEKAGLVTELDTYIWEEVCKWQRSMIDRGKKTVPVSVNVSRLDMVSIDVPKFFGRLIRKYQISPELIDIEITESAYDENIDVMNNIVHQLRNQGFKVYIDDFGSAYSSLNMLKEIEVDAIKIDMRFLHWNGANVGKAIDILETVCNMANVLKLDIIAEGVETKEQKDMLIKTGCIVGQGNYFSFPLSINEFEHKIKNFENISVSSPKEKNAELFYLKDLMNKNILSQNMLSNMLGAVAFYDLCEDNLSILRYNDKYAELIGNDIHHTEKNIVFGKQLYEEEHEKVMQLFADAQKNRQEGCAADIRRKRPDGNDMWLHLRVFFLYHKDGHSIFYSTVSDVTKVHRNNVVLRFLNNDMPGGYYRHEFHEDMKFTHISKRFLDIFGYTREEIKLEFNDQFVNMIHPEDRQQVLEHMMEMRTSGGNYSYPCRMRSKNGYIYVLDQSRLLEFDNKQIIQGIILCDLDFYSIFKNGEENKDKDDITTTFMPCGVFRSEVDGNHTFSYISNSMLHMLGYSRDEFMKKFQNTTENLVYKDDLERINMEVMQQMKTSQFISTEYRIEMADGSLKWVYNRSRLTIDSTGKRWFYSCIMDYDDLKEKFQMQEWQNKKYQSLMETPGVLVYDYNPMLDELTIEMSLENGEREIIVASEYVQNMEEHGYLTAEHVEKERKNLIDASQHALSGVTEFEGCFSKTQGLQWYRFHYISLADETGKVYRIVGRGENITEEKSNVISWKQKAMKDSLTGLLNYASAKTIINDMLTKRKQGALILLDVDNFKEVNDTLGHLAGDEMLIEIAKTLKNVFKEENIIARFGGDEFLVFIHEDEENAESLLTELLENITHISRNGKIHAKCSAGLVYIQNENESLDELFQQADDALYESKRNGKNTYTIYR